MPTPLPAEHSRPVTPEPVAKELLGDYLPATLADGDRYCATIERVSDSLAADAAEADLIFQEHVRVETRDGNPRQ